VTRVVAVRATENHGSGKLLVPKFPMRSFAAGGLLKTSVTQVGDQLADFTWHPETSTK